MAPKSPRRVRARPSHGLEEYVAAQAYAACLIAERCVELEPTNPLAVARRLRTTTFFGGFELGPDGLQVGHHLSAVQWRGGRRELLLADAVWQRGRFPGGRGPLTE